MGDSIWQLPFDQFQRYRLLADIVGILEQNGERQSVLEVGGWPPKLGDFLPGREITVVDQVEAEAPGYIRASGLSLPFTDHSFDMAVSIDALEHVAPAERPKFIAELHRVSRGVVILAAPFAAAEVQEADRAIFDFIRSYSGYEHPFLKEHLEIAPPDQAETVACLAAAGLDVGVLPSGRLDRWLLMMIIYYTLDGDPELKASLDGIMAAYNRAYYPFDICEPAYRHFLVGAPRGSERLAGLGGLVKGDAGPQPDPRELQVAIEVARMIKEHARDREIARLRAMVEVRDAEITALKELNAALQDFRGKVQGLPLYSFYEQHFKKKK